MNTKDYFISSWLHELDACLNCTNAIPEEKSGYTPNPKTRTAREIVEHIIGHPLDIIEAIDSGAIHHRVSMPAGEFTGAAEDFKKNSGLMIDKLKKVDDNTWDNSSIPFYFYGQEIKDMEMPLRDISWQLFRDIIHHRGQLSTYYRPMGVRNPVIYGLTREIMDEMMAAQKK